MFKRLYVAFLSALCPPNYSVFGLAPAQSGPRLAPVNRLFIVFELQLPGQPNTGNGVFVGNPPQNLDQLRALERDVLQQAKFTYPTATNVVITNIQSLTPQ